MKTVLTTREVALRLGASRHCVVKVVDRLGLGRRVGRVRVPKEENLDAIAAGLRAAGYVKGVPSRADRVPPPRPDRERYLA